MGTFCVVIQKPLIVSNCPIPKGTCFWKHRLTGQCKYKAENSSLSVGELSKLVGLPAPSESQALEIRNNLLGAIRKDLSSS